MPWSMRGKYKVAWKKKRKLLYKFSYDKYIENFEVFCRDKNFSKNLLFLRSVPSQMTQEHFFPKQDSKRNSVVSPSHRRTVTAFSIDLLRVLAFEKGRASSIFCQSNLVFVKRAKTLKLFESSSLKEQKKVFFFIILGKILHIFNEFFLSHSFLVIYLPNLKTEILISTSSFIKRLRT